MRAVEAYAASVTVEELDRDPYPVCARLRAEAPVCLVPAVGLWFVTRWADVEAAATRPEIFCARVDLPRRADDGRREHPARRRRAAEAPARDARSVSSACSSPVRSRR